MFTGANLSDLRARQIRDDNFDNYDLILVIDWENLAFVQDECPPQRAINPRIGISRSDESLQRELVEALASNCQQCVRHD